MGDTSANGSIAYCVWDRGLAIIDNTVCCMGTPF